MSGLTITEHIVELGLAKNKFQAGHMATGLRLWELHTIELQMERVRLYRRCRDAGQSRADAFANAIEGKHPMELPELSEVGNKKAPD
jgi:hypothetical protein